MALTVEDTEHEEMSKDKRLALTVRFTITLHTNLFGGDVELRILKNETLSTLIATGML
jgi:hypothetical protein